MLRPHAVFALALVLTLAACRAQRELQITTDPPGAEIRIDGTLQKVRTPAHIPFKDYGVRRITLYLDGYITYSDIFDVNPPWYAVFPFDILSEVVFPVGWRDKHKLKVKLVPGDARIPAPDLVRVLQRAETLRREGPEGARREAKRARELPRETSLLPPPAPAPKPPPGDGGGDP